MDQGPCRASFIVLRSRLFGRVVLQSRFTQKDQFRFPSPQKKKTFYTGHTHMQKSVAHTRNLKKKIKKRKNDCLPQNGPGELDPCDELGVGDGRPELRVARTARAPAQLPREGRVEAPHHPLRRALQPFRFSLWRRGSLVVEHWESPVGFQYSPPPPGIA